MTPDPPPLGEGNLPILPMWTNAAGVADRFGGGEQRSAGAPPPQTVEPEVDPSAARRLNTLGSASESNGPAHAPVACPRKAGHPSQGLERGMDSRFPRGNDNRAGWHPI
jgi:hypothetical protein